MLMQAEVIRRMSTPELSDHSHFKLANVQGSHTNDICPSPAIADNYGAVAVGEHVGIMVLVKVNAINPQLLLSALHPSQLLLKPKNQCRPTSPLRVVVKGVGSREGDLPPCASITRRVPTPLLCTCRPLWWKTDKDSPTSLLKNFLKSPQMLASPC
jgi:hypothetical protein